VPLLEECVRRTAARVLGVSPTRLDPSRPLAEAGLDSLMGIELVNRLEAETGVRLPAEKLARSPGIHSIAGLLAAEIGAAREP